MAEYSSSKNVGHISGMHCIVLSWPEEDVEESEPEEHAESAKEGAAQVEVVAVGGEEGSEAKGRKDCIIHITI